MAKKGFLTRAMNAVSKWMEHEFPSREVEDELAKQGWTTEMYYPTAFGYAGMMAPTPAKIIKSPTGEMVVPGNEAHQQYKEALKAAIAKCAQEKDQGPKAPERKL